MKDGGGGGEEREGGVRSSGKGREKKGKPGRNWTLVSSIGLVRERPGLILRDGQAAKVSVIGPKIALPAEVIAQGPASAQRCITVRESLAI